MLIFPALLTAGMTLIDTTDSILLLGAYGWAFVKSLLYYKMTITFVSVVIALFVGGMEALSIICNRMGLDRAFWRLIANLNADRGSFGIIAVGVFVLSWVVSALIYRIKGYDRIEVTGAAHTLQWRLLTGEVINEATGQRPNRSGQQDGNSNAASSSHALIFVILVSVVDNALLNRWSVTTHRATLKACFRRGDDAIDKVCSHWNFLFTREQSLRNRQIYHTKINGKLN